MKVSDVMACSFSQWYTMVKKVTPRSKILPLPPEVVSYLLDEQTIRLPQESDSDWHKPSDKDRNEDNFDDDEEEEEPVTDWDGVEADSSEDDVTAPTFPEFSSELRSAIAALGGTVFCKLNWSAPRDASWMALGNSLACSDLMQVYLLLKSSEFVAHDLSMPFKACDDREHAPHVQYELVLRQWQDINPSHEFRCFVRANRLISVMQRDCSKYYSYISGEKASILGDIRTFYLEHVQNKFPLTDYVFDVVRPRKDKVFLLDFGPFGETTDSMLYDWGELKTSEFPSTDFRHVENDAGIQPSNLRQFSLPTDMVDLSTGSDPDKLIDFLRLQVQ